MGNKHLCITLLACVACCAACGTTGAQVGRYRADFAVAPTDFADSIAIEWTGQQVYVPVTVGGRTYRFLLDTGAGQGVVFAGTELAQGPPAGTIISHDGAGHTDTVSVVQLPPMQIGHVTLSGCRATVQPRLLPQSAQGAPTAIDGILGFDLVNGGLSLTIDVARRLLVLTDRPVQAPGGHVELKYRLNYHVPYVDITPLGRHRERVLIDTGSPQFFAMSKQSYDAAAPRQQKWTDFEEQGRAQGHYALGHFGAEAPGEVVFLRLDSLRLGSYAFSRLCCLTTQGGSHLGAALLAHGALTFDARRQRMLFCPYSTVQPCPVDNGPTAIAFVPDALGMAQVGLVWPGGEPYRVGFRRGDVIERIDGRPVHSLAQFARWAFEPGREYRFTLRRPDGQRRTVGWVRIAQ